MVVNSMRHGNRNLGIRRRTRHVICPTNAEIILHVILLCLYQIIWTSFGISTHYDFNLLNVFFGEWNRKFKFIESILWNVKQEILIQYCRKRIKHSDAKSYYFIVDPPDEFQQP